MLHASTAPTAKHVEMKKSVMSMLKAEPRKPLSGHDLSSGIASVLENKKVRKGRIEMPPQDSAAGRIMQRVSQETIRTRRFCAFVFSPLLVCWMEGVQHLMHIANPFFKCPDLRWQDDYSRVSEKELRSNRKVVAKAAALRLAVQWVLNVRPACDGAVIANLVKFDENFSLAFKYAPGLEGRFVTEGFVLFTDILHVMLWQISHYSAIDVGCSLARHVDPRVVLRCFGEDTESVLEWARSFLFTQLLSPMALQRLYLTQIRLYDVMNRIFVSYASDPGAAGGQELQCKGEQLQCNEEQYPLLQTLDKMLFGSDESDLEAGCADSAGEAGARGVKLCKAKAKAKNRVKNKSQAQAKNKSQAQADSKSRAQAKNKSQAQADSKSRASDAVPVPGLSTVAEPRASDPVRLSYDQRYLYFLCSAAREPVETGQTVDTSFVYKIPATDAWSGNVLLVSQRMGMHGAYDVRSQNGFVFTSNYQHVPFEESIALALEYGKVVMAGKQVHVTFPRCVIEDDGYVDCGCRLMFTELGSHIVYCNKQGEMMRIVPVLDVQPVPLQVPLESAIQVDDVYPQAIISMVDLIEALDASTDAVCTQRRRSA